MDTQPAPTPPPSDPPPARDFFTPGILAGVAGAVAMGLVAMFVSAAQGLGLFTPMKLVAGTFLGARALDTVAAGAVGAVVLGVVIHLFLGAVFGVVYATWLPRKVGVVTELWMSLLYGAGLFVVMTWLIMPWADPVMFGHVEKTWLLVYNLVYGVSLVAHPPHPPGGAGDGPAPRGPRPGVTAPRGQRASALGWRSMTGPPS